MEDEQIKEKLTAAIAELQEKDGWLLNHNLSEQSISHKLAEYLQRYFSDYHVDCEYNGDIDDVGRKKHILLLFSQLEEYGLLKQRETQLEAELIERAVFPDIIVHRRGSNENNLLIIEVKKTSSKVPFDYDDLKLKAYTSEDYDNHLRYQLGAFIVTANDAECTVYYYKNGHRLQR